MCSGNPNQQDNQHLEWGKAPANGEPLPISWIHPHEEANDRFIYVHMESGQG